MGTTGVIASVRDDDGVPMALVDTRTDGVIGVCLLTCPQAEAGDTVLVHCGYVLQIVGTPGPPGPPGPAPAGIR